MDEIEQLIPHLYSFDARAASKRLVELGAAAVEPLVAVLSGAYPVPDVIVTSMGVPAPPDRDAARERAAYLLGEIGDASAVEPLIATFSGAAVSDRYLRLAAARALGRIGDARAVDTLIAALAVPAWTPDFNDLVAALHRIDAERAVEPLIGVLLSERHTYGCAAHAARLLGTRRDDARVVTALCAALRLDAEFATVQAVIEQLSGIDDPAAHQALAGLITQMIHLPAERWDDREDNLSETDQGMVFHVLKTEFAQAAAALRQMGKGDVLEKLLRDAPGYVE
jgi:HEAT repeat protein